MSFPLVQPLFRYVPPPASSRNVKDIFVIPLSLSLSLSLSLITLVPFNSRKRITPLALDQSPNVSLSFDYSIRTNIDLSTYIYIHMCVYMYSTTQLRYLQTLSNISAEKNSTIIFPLPVEFLTPFFNRSSSSQIEGQGNGTESGEQGCAGRLTTRPHVHSNGNVATK